jgi:hypothetical protein
LVSVSVLVNPVEKLYVPAFQRSWQHIFNKIRLTSPGDLEAMDSHLKKLEYLYFLSGIKHFNGSNTHYDDYGRKIKSMKDDLIDTISKKFKKTARQISDLIGDPESVSEPGEEKDNLVEAFALFRMLRSFHRRWKLDTKEYRRPEDIFDFDYALKELSYKLAKKRVLLINEQLSNKNSQNLSEKNSRSFESTDDLFAIYSSNVEDIHSILQRGFIFSDSSISFSVASALPESGVGFVFPLNAVINDCKSYHIIDSSLNSELNSEKQCGKRTCIVTGSPGNPLRFDICKSTFFAPKNTLVSYVLENKKITESSEEYFKRFFSVLSKFPSTWIKESELNNWLKNSCVFYEE